MLTAGLKDLNGVTSDDIADLSFTERRLVPVDAILASTTRLLGDLEQFVQASSVISVSPSKLGLAEILINAANTATAYRDNVAVLLLKCTSTQEVLNNILNLNNQRIAQQQNDRVYYLTTATVDDSATVRVITAITLVFLSFTAIAVSIPHHSALLWKHALTATSLTGSHGHATFLSQGSGSDTGRVSFFLDLRRCQCSTHCSTSCILAPHALPKAT
jgi:hypothetical protein